MKEASQELSSHHKEKERVRMCQELMLLVFQIATVLLNYSSHEMVGYQRPDWLYNGRAETGGQEAGVCTTGRVKRESDRHLLHKHESYFDFVSKSGVCLSLEIAACLSSPELSRPLFDTSSAQLHVVLYAHSTESGCVSIHLRHSISTQCYSVDT